MTYYRYCGFYEAMRQDLGRIASAYCSLFLWLLMNAMLETEDDVTEREILVCVDQTIQYHASQIE